MNDAIKVLVQQALTALEKGDLLCEVTAACILRQAIAQANSVDNTPIQYNQLG